MSSKKSLEKETKFVSIGEQQGMRGYISKLKGYIMRGTPIGEHVSANSAIVYSKRYLYHD